MSGCITISPMGGLANRMRAILSARALAKDAGAQLRVLWNVSHELGCEPHWLFHTKNWDFDWRTTTANTHHWLWKPAGKSNLFIPAVWQRLKFTQHIHDRTHLLNKSISTQQLLTAAQTNLYITSGLEFYPYNHADTAKIFAPTEQIEVMVEEKLEQMLDCKKIGIHIRRTDNQQSILHSPDRLFSDMMRQQIQCNRNAMFYLATDSSEVKQKLTHEFAARIVTSPDDACRSSRHGIMEAWAEMLALSHMDLIIGSYYSSFSEMAAQIGNVPLVMAKK